jgi:hypothetical protein
MFNTLLNVVWWIELYNFFLNLMIVDGFVVFISACPDRFFVIGFSTIDLYYTSLPIFGI